MRLLAPDAVVLAEEVCSFIQHNISDLVASESLVHFLVRFERVPRAFDDDVLMGRFDSKVLFLVEVESYNNELTYHERLGVYFTY